MLRISASSPSGGIHLYDSEIDALNELSYLHRCLYVFALKPYVDYRTGIVGIKRKISWQSIAESLYVKPRTGIKVEQVSKAQLRRAAEQLEKNGLIRNISQGGQLFFKLPLARRDYSVQNKAVREPAHLADTLDRRSDGPFERLADITPKEKAGTPLSNNNINYIFNKKKQAKKSTRENWFERFWQAYPLKREKIAAQKIFFNVVCDESMFKMVLDGLEHHKQMREQLSGMQAQGRAFFIPAWKYPHTWLKYQCWLEAVDYTEVKPCKTTATAQFPINMDFSEIDYGEIE